MYPCPSVEIRLGPEIGSLSLKRKLRALAGVVDQRALEVCLSALMVGSSMHSEAWLFCEVLV